MPAVPLIAYVDPASGTIILQLLIAGIVGFAGFFHKTIWRFLSVFSRSSKSGDGKPTE